MRVLGAVAGALIVMATATSVARALVIPRGRMGWLQHGTDRFVAAIYTALSRLLRSYEARDRLLAGQAVEATPVLPTDQTVAMVTPGPTRAPGPGA